MMASEAQKEDNSKSVSDVKAPNLFERAKEEIEAIGHREHHHESHGTDERIDEETPVEEVKAPNVFERAKEEIEAIVQHIHEKEEPHQDSVKEHQGFWAFFGRKIERFCRPHHSTKKSS
eukprot:Gb_19603 [translate_table: standard]